MRLICEKKRPKPNNLQLIYVGFFCVYVYVWFSENGYQKRKKKTLQRKNKNKNNQPNNKQTVFFTPLKSFDDDDDDDVVSTSHDVCLFESYDHIYSMGCMVSIFVWLWFWLPINYISSSLK